MAAERWRPPPRCRCRSQAIDEATVIIDDDGGHLRGRQVGVVEIGDERPMLLS
jgi:hypothetical protein